MSETLWAVVIGGAIASITAVFTTVFSALVTARIENSKWKREKKLDLLKVKRSGLYDSMLKAIDTIGKYEAMIKQGIEPNSDGGLMLAISSLPVPSNDLWMDVMKALSEQSDDRNLIYKRWNLDLLSQLSSVDLEIEKLLE